MTSAPSNAASRGSASSDADWLGSMGALYDVDRSIANFDGAYYGAMTKPVQAAYLDRSAWVNRYNSTYLRGAVLNHPRDLELDRTREAVADFVGATTGEIALSTGGTEALYALIVNYRPLKAGDAVLYADVDYDEMQYAMDYLAKCRDANVVRFSLPEPQTHANILAAYEKVLKQTPRAKLLLLTHISNRNGLIPPVAEIVAMAKANGVDVILDSAQAVGQMPFDVAATGADFIGFSLHKWVSAPLGTGAVYIRKERLGHIQPWLGNRIYSDDDVRARIPTGTADYAARLTVADAIALQREIGLDAKFSHLRAARNYWVNRVRDVPGIQLMLPDEAENYGAISAFRLAGMQTPTQAREAEALFLKRHKLLVVAKLGLASGPVLRVTPSPFNTVDELDRLVRAIQAECNMFL